MPGVNTTLITSFIPLGSMPFLLQNTLKNGVYGLTITIRYGVYDTFKTETYIVYDLLSRL